MVEGTVRNTLQLCPILEPHADSTIQVQDRARQVIKNLEAVLSAEDMTLKDVVKATIYCTDFDKNFPLVNQVS